MRRRGGEHKEKPTCEHLQSERQTGLEDTATQRKSTFLIAFRLLYDSE